MAFTGEGWTDQVYIFWKANNSLVVALFFGLIIVFGYFFLMNLILAVIYYEFEQLRDAGGSRKKLIELRMSRRANVLSVIAPEILEENHDSKPQLPAARPEEKGTLLVADKKRESIEELMNEQTSKQTIYHDESANSTQVLDKTELQDDKELLTSPEAVNSLEVLKFDQQKKEEEEVYHYKVDTVNSSSNAKAEAHEPSDGKCKKCWDSCKRCWESYRRGCAVIVQKPYFTVFVMLSITVNVIVLCMYEYPIKDDYEMKLDLISWVVAYIFLIELVIRVSGEGFTTHFRNIYNILDALIILPGCAELILFLIYPSYFARGNNFFVKIFRSFRIFRVFRFSKVWKSFSDFSITVTKTLARIWLFIIFLVLVMIVCAGFGMELYAYKVFIGENEVGTTDPSQGAPPRNNFNSFSDAMLSIFVLFTKDCWNSNLLYYLMEATEPVQAVFFSITILVIGYVILLRLFLAITISEFIRTFHETVSVSDPARIEAPSRGRKSIVAAIRAKDTDDSFLSSPNIKVKFLLK